MYQFDYNVENINIIDKGVNLMNVSKLYSTSIASALLSITILTGVASAETTHSTQPTTTGNTTTSPTAKQSLESAVEKAKT